MRAVAPDRRDRQGVMRVDDPGERRLVGFRADIGVGDPDQLIAGDAVAGRGHARQTEVGRIGQDGGEQRVLVVAALAGAQVGEGGGRSRSRGSTSCSSSVMRTGGSIASIRSANASASGGVAALTGVTCRRPSRSSTPSSSPRRSRRAKRFSRRSSSAPRAASHSSAVAGRPSFGRDRRHRRRRQQVAVEAAIVGRSLDPDVAGAQLVAQRGENGGFVEPPVWPTRFGNQPLPILSERHRRVGGDLTLARAVEIAQQANCGERRFSGRRCGARKPDAVSDDQLLHRAAGYLSVTQLTPTPQLKMI